MWGRLHVIRVMIARATREPIKIPNICSQYRKLVSCLMRSAFLVSISLNSSSYHAVQLVNLWMASVESLMFTIRLSSTTVRASDEFSVISLSADILNWIKYIKNSFQFPCCCILSFLPTSICELPVTVETCTHYLLRTVFLTWVQLLKQHFTSWTTTPLLTEPAESVVVCKLPPNSLGLLFLKITHCFPLTPKNI